MTRVLRMTLFSYYHSTLSKNLFKVDYYCFFLNIQSLTSLGTNNLIYNVQGASLHSDNIPIDVHYFV